MKILRTPTVIAACLWLALPSTHVLALCIDGDGSFALEAAVDGACTGLRPSDGGRAPTTELGLAAHTVGCCGDCTDVVLGGGGAAIPPHTVSASRKSERQVDNAAEPTPARGSSPPQAVPRVRFGSCAQIPKQPLTWDSVVLRL